MKRCFVVGSAVWVLVWTAAASAAELCVAPAASGSGDGSDWANAKAWTDTPERGDTWYVADGDYPGKTFDVAESGTTPITIRKATIAEHGPGAGWTDALGDGQASFSSSLVFESPHWVVDGVTGGGAGSWDEGFGFKIRSTDDGMAIVRIAYGSPADDVTVRHVDLEGKGSVSDQGGGYSNDAVAIYGASKVTVSHAWIHGAGRCPFFIDTADSVFEHIWVQSYFGSNAVHSEVASIWSFAGLPIGDITFRYNLFTHIVSTGGLMFDNASNPSSHLYVYGNVFYKPPGDPWEQANGLIGGWTGGNGEQMHNVWVDDNTFVGIDQSTLSTLPNVASGSRAQNNLWVGSDAPSFSKFETHDYNHFVDSGDAQGEAHGTTAAGDPFVDLASLDFLLIANTEPGLDLGPPFDVDGLGHARKTWTRGAFELCEGTACDPSGTGGAGGAGTGGSGAGASGTGGGGAGGAGSGAASGSSSGSGADATDDGGCGCRAAPLNDDRSALGVGAAMALLAWARARRRSIRAGRVA